MNGAEGINPVVVDFVVNSNQIAGTCSSALQCIATPIIRFDDPGDSGARRPEETRGESGVRGEDVAGAYSLALLLELTITQFVICPTVTMMPREFFREITQM